MAQNAYLQWLTSKTKSVYWNDSAVSSDLATAVANGATGVTTNPFLVNAALRAEPERWQSVLASVPRSLQGDEKAEALTIAVTSEVAKDFERFVDPSNARFGGVCAQVNPNKAGDTDAMIAQAKRYAQAAKNICIKLPATRSGLEALEECAALGLNVVSTVSFTVPQVLAAGEAFSRGAARARANGIKPGLGVAVIMVGRLCEYVRDIARDQKIDVSEADIMLAGTACMKRAYSLFRERGYEAVLMPAAQRCLGHVTDLSGADMIMTFAPKTAKQLEALEGPFEEHINDPVDAAVIARLQKIDEFVKAYEPDGLTRDQMYAYGATNRTLAQFIALGWDALTSLSY